jgi:hypothetical protein
MEVDERNAQHHEEKCQELQKPARQAVGRHEPSSASRPIQLFQHAERKHQAVMKIISTLAHSALAKEPQGLWALG